jgi:anti-sigma factor ChrR (cupin superfamily)
VERCSCEEEAVAYAAGELSPADATRVGSHLSGCEDCRFAAELYERITAPGETLEERMEAEVLARAMAPAVLEFVRRAAARRAKKVGRRRRGWAGDM